MFIKDLYTIGMRLASPETGEGIQLVFATQTSAMEQTDGMPQC